MRSRLRKQALSAAIVVVFVLCICIAWAGIELQSLSNGGTFGLLLGLQSVILIVMGATQVGSAVGTTGVRDARLPSRFSVDSNRAHPWLFFGHRSANMSSSPAHCRFRCSSWLLVRRVFMGLCSS